MAWSLDLDDFSGNCGQPWPILTAIREHIIGMWHLLIMHLLKIYDVPNVGVL
jgi:hypothetical protein